MMDLTNIKILFSETKFFDYVIFECFQGKVLFDSDVINFFLFIIVYGYIRSRIEKNIIYRS